MSQDEIAAGITAFIRDRFLDGDDKGELDETTPLLEWGVLNSLNLYELLSHIRDEWGVAVPANAVAARNFRTVRDITALVVTLTGTPVD